LARVIPLLVLPAALMLGAGVAHGTVSTRFHSISKPEQAGPLITTLPAVIDIGDNLMIGGSGFTDASVVNFFVATSNGPVNYGPLVPGSNLPDSLIVFLPDYISQGEGVASVVVVDTDEGHVSSNAMLALLQGDPTQGMPSLTAINGVGLSPTSVEPGVALANVETVVGQGESVTLTGTGFDTVNGVSVDLFCDCAGGKIPTITFNPGEPGLEADSVTLTLPTEASGLITGPGAFRITNTGDSDASAAVSVPIGAQIAVNQVTQEGSTVTVDGSGFSSLTVINLFNLQGDQVVNLGGLDADGSVLIPINLVSETELTFSVPAGAVSGPGYVQALNPPFIPYTSSGNSSGGSFELM
jgi:hypothetical protein